MSSGWRLRTIVHEALANLGASGIRGGVVGIALSTMVAGLVSAELATAADVKDQVRRFDAAGGRVAVVDGPDGLAADRCEELRWRPFVSAAGGWRRTGQRSALNAPRVPFELWEITGDIVRVWDPRSSTPSRPGYVVGRAVAQEIGLRDGAWLGLDGMPAAPVTVADPSDRNPLAARAILDPVAPSGRLAQCWVELVANALPAALSYLPAHFAPDEVEARPLTSRGAFDVNPGEMLARRPQRWAWVLVGLVGATVLTLAALFRRADAAVYRAFGLRRLGLLLMHQVEAIVLVSGALLIGSLWGITAEALRTGPPSADAAWLALRSSTLAAAVTVLVGPLGAWLAGAGSPAVLLKER